MLVTRVLGDCPGCGGNERFGNVSVRGNYVLRGCMSCKYSTKIWLPKTRKKIIYLDQFFFSSAFRDRDIRFVNAADKIRHVSGLQLLAAPFSSVHEDETQLWRGYDGKNKDDLMQFIKATSGGHEFKPAYDVERTQIVRSFQAFLSAKPSTFLRQDCDVIDGDIHKWDDYFRIDVGRYIGDIELMRDLKRQSLEGLIDLFPAWKESKNTFDQDVVLELQSSAKGYVDSYFEYATRVALGDYDAIFNSPIMSMIVQSLLYCLPDDQALEDRLKIIGNFFRSSHFSEIPYQILSARIYAKLKEMVRYGAYQNREKALKSLSGFFYDVKHIATYAPYCDAFVMDQPMASIISDSRIGLETGYNVKIFSLNNWEELSTWLTTLEEEMSPEHRAGLTAAYP